MRIAVIHNYDLNHGWNNVRRGRCPDHLIYGINHFEKAGHRVDVVPFSGTRTLFAADRLVRRARLTCFTGSLARQLPLLRIIHQYDAVYAPCENQTSLLALLRRWNLIRVPLIVLAHHPPPGNRCLRGFNRLLVQGADAWPSISPRSAAEWQSLAPSKETVCPFVPWGPDVDFYPDYTDPGEHLFISGRSHRDHALMARVSSRVSIPCTVMCGHEHIASAYRSHSARTRIIGSHPLHWHFDDVTAAVRDALAVAIPLRRTDQLVGLSSLMDAMAMGRAVLMTFNPYVFPDIEEMGFGWWVRSGDEDGWVDAIHRVRADPARTREMGLRARDYVARHMNSRRFAESMLAILHAGVHHGTNHPETRGVEGICE